MQVAGPVQSGDMVVRSGQASPGITALLAKESRKQRGIFQLPPTEEPQKDFYNMALSNVQNQLRGAAQTINAMAPEGESLAYINPQEAGILKLLGGSGEPEPVTGIPSYYTPGGGQYGGYSKPRFTTDKPGGERDKRVKENQKKYIGKGPTGPANTQFQQTAEGLAAAIKEATGESYGDQAKGAITSFIGTAGITDEGKYDPLKAAQGLVDIAKGGSEEQKSFFKDKYKDISKSLKRSLGAYDYGGKTFLGLGDGFVLGDDTKNILKAAQTLGQLPRDKNFIEKITDFSILKNLFGNNTEDMSIAELTEMYNRQDEMRKQEEERRRRGGGRDDKPAPQESAGESSEENEEEEEFPYFNYRRKFMQPMDYESIIARAYQGGEGSLLQNLGEAIKESKES